MGVFSHTDLERSIRTFYHAGIYRKPNSTLRNHKFISFRMTMQNQSVHMVNCSFLIYVEFFGTHDKDRVD